MASDFHGFGPRISAPPPYPPPITYGPGTFLNHNANACEIECTSGRRLEDATDPLALPASAVDEQAKLKEMVSAFLTAHQAQLAALRDELGC